MRRLLIFPCAALLAACGHTYTPSGYDSLTYSANISKEPAFSAMKRYEGIFSHKFDSTPSASTDVKLTVAEESRNHSFTLDNLRCDSWIDADTDTLRVAVFQSDGFTTHGVAIGIKDGKFKCKPYYVTDVFDPDRKEPHIDIERQQLILSRQKFQAGDSLYGYVYVKAIVDGKQKKHAEGYFRARIGGKDRF